MVESEVKVIELELENTKDSLRDTLGAMENKVGQTKERLKETVNVKNQFHKHPFELLGGAILTGFLVGMSASKRKGLKYAALTVSRGSERGVNRFFGLFHNELGMARGLLMGALVNKVGNVLSDNLPKWSTEIREIFDSASSKLQADHAKEVSS